MVVVIVTMCMGVGEYPPSEEPYVESRFEAHAQLYMPNVSKSFFLLSWTSLIPYWK